MTDYLFDLVIAQLWQVTVIAVMAWLLAEMLFKNRPRLQYAVWTVVLLKCLVPPLAPSLVWPAVLSGPSAWNHRESMANVSIVIGAELDSSVDVRGLHSPPVSPVAIASYRPSFVVWSEIAGGVWLLGFAVILSLVVIHILWCRRQFRRVYRSPVRMLNAVVSELREICPGRMVRIFLTRGQFGPAAMSPLRPVIVVPGALAKQLATDELRSILTHELMHVRRGDLWLGWMQMVAVCLFWFHPLVWLASRRLSVAIEQCCDEDSVRWLRCEPSVYRRSLAATLLWKNSVPTLPLAYAIRPAQLTRCRMEALMKIDPLRPASSWKSHILMVAMAILLLPGARWPALAVQPPNEPIANQAKDEANKAIETGSEKLNSDLAETIKPFPVIYRVSDLLPSCRNSDARGPGDFSHPVFRSELEELMREIQATVSPDTWEAREGYGTIAPYMQTVSIVISTTTEVHDAVAEFLERKRAVKSTSANSAGVPPMAGAVNAEASLGIDLCSVIIVGQKKDLANLCDDWADLGNEVAEITKRSIPPSTDNGGTSQPLRVQLGAVSIAVAEQLVRNNSSAALDRGTRVLSAPTIRIPLKQTGMVAIGDDIVVTYSDDNGQHHKTRSWGGVRLSLNADVIEQRTRLAIEWSSQELAAAEENLRAIEKRTVKTSTELVRGQAALLLVSQQGDDKKATLIAIWKSE